MSASDRVTIAKLAKAAHGGLLDVHSAADALALSPKAAAAKLAALARRDWLVRARRGLYLVPALEAEPGRSSVAEDPWILAREAFSPCYIGGWSAAEHWELTEQIFRSTLVVTAANVRAQSIKLLGHEFRLFRIPRSRITGTTLVWRGSERVPVSDRERTIIDALRSPEICGGIRLVADIMREYNRQEHDLKKLIEVAKKTANGAAWKRLGYLAEILWPHETALPDEASGHLTSGNVKLDPTIRARGKLARRWKLWVNAKVGSETDQT